MTGLRIEIDVKQLVHQAWDDMPWWMRLVVLVIPRLSREGIEAEAVRRITAAQGRKP